MADASLAGEGDDSRSPRHGDERRHGNGTPGGASHAATKGAARRGGGRPQSREVQISKALSRLLRHQADKAGIALDDEGFASLDRVLAYGPLRALGTTLADVQTAARDNDKQRFSLKPKPAAAPESVDAADYLVRANQGHSIRLASASLHEPLTLAAGNVPPRVLHGTYFAFWPAIVASGGLRPMGRTHVHCSTGTPEEGVVSGMRWDAELIIEIDVAGSLAAGLTWWRSDNGVVLTEGDDRGLLSSSFFKLVRGRSTDVGTLWQDGVHVADLPSDIKARVPPGKGQQGPRRGHQGGGRGGRKRESYEAK